MGGPPIENATVIVRGRTVEYAGPGGGATVPKDAQVIDATAKTVMPGLSDMHVHLQGAWDGVSVDLLGYQRYMNAMLYAGITTLMDTGNYQPWVLQLRQEQAAGRLVGPRIYCVGAMIDSADPAWPDFAYAVASRYQIPEIVKRDKAAKVDMIKGYSNLSEHKPCAPIYEIGATTVMDWFRDTACRTPRVCRRRGWKDRGPNTCTCFLAEIPDGTFQYALKCGRLSLCRAP